MAYKIIYKKRYLNSLDKLILYLEKALPVTVAHNFLDILDNSLSLLRLKPNIGLETSIKNTKTILITKHNRLYYRIEKDKIIILNMIDTRRNPKSNPFKKQVLLNIFLCRTAFFISRQQFEIRTAFWVCFVLYC